MAEKARIKTVKYCDGSYIVDESFDVEIVFSLSYGVQNNQTQSNAVGTTTAYLTCNEVIDQLHGHLEGNYIVFDEWCDTQDETEDAHSWYKVVSVQRVRNYFCKTDEYYILTLEKAVNPCL